MTRTSPFVYQTILNGDHTHENIDGLIANDLSENQTLWQHLDLNESAALDWLNNKSGLEPLILDALCAEETRPRSFKAANGLLVVLRGLNTNPGHNPEDMVSVRMWIEKNRILTVRRRTILSVQDIVQDLDKGLGPRNAPEFLTELIDKMANRVGDFVGGIEDDLSDLEEKADTIGAQEFRSVLGSLRRQIAVVRRYMSPQRDALDRLNFVESNVLSDRDRQCLREESDRVSRYLEDLDLARERAVVLQEAFMTQIAQQQNNRMYVLSIISIIFLPLGFLTGLLGINIGGIPGAQHPQAFWFFVTGLIVIVGFQFWLLRKFKWL
jgi:zinc transporter